MQTVAWRPALVASLAMTGIAVALAHGQIAPDRQNSMPQFGEPAGPSGMIELTEPIDFDAKAVGDLFGEAGPIGEIDAKAVAAADFLATNPGSRVFEHSGRIERVYGRAFANGASPILSAERFRIAHAGMWGVRADDLMPVSGMADGRHTTPVMIDRETGQFKFTLVMYSQFRDGIPVWNSQLRLLVRNESDHPLVLATANLRDIGDFAVPADALELVRPDVLAPFAIAEIGGGEIFQGEPVIFAGHGTEVREPRLAWSAFVVNDEDEWRVILDAETRQVLHKEHLICFQAVTGTVSANVTSGIGADICDPEVLQPLPYVRVSGSGQVVYTDVDGAYSMPVFPLEIVSELDGLWFDVTDFGGPNSTVTVFPGFPGFYPLVHNPGSNALVRAQVNAYLESNRIRDFVLVHNPAYPTLMDPDFTVIVNRTDGFCPGNAWYSPAETSINFCQAGPNNPNTSFASVIFHEYGHHLVNAGGSGQGAYGEGMGDVMSVIMLDSPLIGLGFFNNCTQPLRNADNDCQFQSSGCSSCGSAIHACGRLLSGAVWSTRNELFASDPSDYLDILSSLAINSILLHVGTSINPSITIDFLTLDDDNGDILDGTPHYHQINNGFSQHNMPGPALAPFKFTFPNGLPSLISPSGVSIDVVLEPIIGFPQANTGEFHYRPAGSNGSFTTIPMTPTGEDEYVAVVPALDCGSQIEYFFSAESTTGQDVSSPSTAPAGLPTAWISEAEPVSVWYDDFTQDLGWNVTNSPGLTDGWWERGIPVTNCDRGNPVEDADGSGWCYLTRNNPGDCNSDVDDGTTYLLSPILDATVPNAHVEYWRWFSNTQGNSPFQDRFFVDFSNDGGATWVPVEVVGPGGPEVDGGWVHKIQRIDLFVAPTANFRVRFAAEDLPPGSVVEAAVDGVGILSLECLPPGVFGDLNGDGVVDGADLGLLLQNWGQPGLGDLNGDGIVDGADIGLLLNNWT